ncbi:hypothetical protein HBN50_08715 [Halobacteriovorax sp. GB3]|uniref:hypothetical protein n=1 Tax=Halobacteriovorax sp. GB3 TaxID=2719615 RepID=UPI0023600FBA|nr:hypothetical protein [Halobacteriovorax sp. GB3]MDD0853177.1 hypothetical protein [Halobacteriovorax sp. GB3]
MKIIETLVPFSKKKGLSIKFQLQSIHDDLIQLSYEIIGDSPLFHSSNSKEKRQRELWMETCFELFLKSKDGHYLEFNFTHDGRWNCYEFASYRSDLLEAKIQGPVAFYWNGERSFDTKINLSPYNLDDFDFFNATAVLSYDYNQEFLALDHPQERPDFHDGSCFKEL